MENAENDSHHSKSKDYEPSGASHVSRLAVALVVFTTRHDSNDLVACPPIKEEKRREKEAQVENKP